ncbi:DISARM system phospholipase D-like protein DrmC [Ruegeria faecimaris]|uniref:DISARM system phospholipase D-like protein DrmC n=1 Tax=Ruegeria faecimaris TaxID=686389 RepID=UPI00249293F2|nr:DISARM system phospholipase D-like protein DrmC [Ruegeria faecimaris]
MKDLLDAITDLVSNTPPNQVEGMAERLRAGIGIEEVTSSWAVSAASRQRISNVAAIAKGQGVGSARLSDFLLGASHAYHREKNEEVVELVLTGPSTPAVSTRRTESALLQVIDASRSSLFLTSFVAYDVASVVKSLRAASKRNVQVSIVLESSESHGGAVGFDVIGNMRSTLPEAHVYYWKEKSPGFLDGKVHAKVAVADRRLCFVSSANLTGHAMEKNIEAGVLVEGGDTPRRLQEHLEALVTTRIIAKQ